MKFKKTLAIVLSFALIFTSAVMSFSSISAADLQVGESVTYTPEKGLSLKETYEDMELSAKQSYEAGNDFWQIVDNSTTKDTFTPLYMVFDFDAPVSGKYNVEFGSRNHGTGRMVDVSINSQSVGQIDGSDFTTTPNSNFIVSHPLDDTTLDKGTNSIKIQITGLGNHTDSAATRLTISYLKLTLEEEVDDIPDEVKAVKDPISKIGKVEFTFESGKRIYDAKKVYDELNSELQQLVSNYPVLLEAIEEFSRLDDENNNGLVLDLAFDNVVNSEVYDSYARMFTKGEGISVANGRMGENNALLFGTNQADKDKIGISWESSDYDPIGRTDGKISISAWVKPSASDNHTPIFSYGTSNNNNPFFILKTKGLANDGLSIGVRNSAIKEDYASGVALSYDTWSLVTYTQDGTNAKLYINEQPVWEKTDMAFNLSDISDSEYTYAVGYCLCWPDPRFQGTMDNFQIYSKALTGAEISELIHGKITELNIAEVANPNGITVDYNTATTELDLPEKVNVLLSDDSTKDLSVVWDTDELKPTTVGEQTLTGTITLEDGILNPDNLTASIVVTVKEEQKTDLNITAVEGLEDITVRYNTSAESLSLPEKVGVTLSDDSTKELSVQWKTDGYKPTTIGEQTLPGTITLEEGILNTNNLTASIVIKVNEEVQEDVYIKEVRNTDTVHEAEYGTAVTELPLPEKFDVTLSDNTTVKLAVEWNTDKYDPTVTDKMQLLTGTLVLQDGIKNPDNLIATMAIKVKEKINDTDDDTSKEPDDEKKEPGDTDDHPKTGESSKIALAVLILMASFGAALSVTKKRRVY